MLNGKTTIILLTVGLIKKIQLCKTSYFPEPHTHNRKYIFDLPNYGAKVDLKKAADVDTSNYAKKYDLASIKSDVDQLYIDKLKSAPSGLDSLESKVDKLHVEKLVPVTTDLSKLSDVVKNEVVKKSVYDESVKNVYTINTSGIIIK